DIGELLAAYEKAAQTRDRPTIVLARTTKGKGLPGIEGNEHWHGKALDRDAANKVVSELGKQIRSSHPEWKPKLPSPLKPPPQHEETVAGKPAAPPYAVGGKDVSTRKGFGEALAALAPANSRVVVLDGDVKNSTYTEEFEKAASNR